MAPPKRYRTEIGTRYGSRVVTAFLKTRDTDGHIRIRWKCDCGTRGTAGLKSFRHTVNCQMCRNHDQIHLPVHGHAGRGTRTHLYDCWANMMQRVRGTGSERNRQWYAGIKACKAWRKFESFRDWAVANGYAEGLSLERINPRRNYEPSNCEWITRAENSRRSALAWRQDFEAWRRERHQGI